MRTDIRKNEQDTGARRDYDRTFAVLLICEIISACTAGLINTLLSGYADGVSAGPAAAALSSTLSAAVSAVPPICILCRNGSGAFRMKRRMPISEGLRLFCIMCLLSFAGWSIAGLLSGAGFIGLPSLNLSSYDGVPVILIIAGTVITAPVAEEVLYRGWTGTQTERHGLLLSAVISSAAFALAHMNIRQLPAAFLQGMFFYYISVRYSVRVSVLFHSLHNMLFSVLPYLLSAMPDRLGSVSAFTLRAADIIYAAAAGAAVVLLIRERPWHRMRNISGMCPEPGAAGEAFSSVWMWAYMIFCTVMMFVSR